MKIETTKEVWTCWTALELLDLVSGVQVHCSDFLKSDDVDLLSTAKVSFFLQVISVKGGSISS